jgi:hypothetical protein
MDTRRATGLAADAFAESASLPDSSSRDLSDSLHDPMSAAITTDDAPTSDA